VPAGALVVAEWPTVVNATTDLQTISATRAMQDTAKLDAELLRRPVFLACDMFCEPRYGGNDSPPACRQLLDRYELAPAETVGGPHRAYGFFRITGPAKPGEHHAICPLAQ
jgi:hypothetical protein